MAEPTTWWGRAFARSAEETAYDEADLAPARRLARSDRMGEVSVRASSASVVVAPGEQRGDQLRVTARLRVSGLDDWDALVAEVAREAGFVAALEAGEMPAELLERADEAGVELLPAPTDLLTTCECDAWTQPCRHALALLDAVARRIDADPYVLLLLRGRSREWLLEQVRARLTAGRVAEQILALAEQAPSGEGLHAAAVAAYDEEVGRLLSPGRGRSPSWPGT